MKEIKLLEGSCCLSKDKGIELKFSNVIVDSNKQSIELFLAESRFKIADDYFVLQEAQEVSHAEDSNTLIEFRCYDVFDTEDIDDMSLNLLFETARFFKNKIIDLAELAKTTLNIDNSTVNQLVNL